MGELKSILQKHNFKFDKGLGQNFISDLNLLRAIVADSGVSKDYYAVEIGAGGGTLTSAIAAAAKKVYAYEIDNALKPVLNDMLLDVNNVELKFTDILKRDIAETEREIGGEYFVIANLPYYITTPLIMYFLENARNCKSITVMVQKEVAERLCAKVGTKSYGSISVAAAFYGGAKITRIVPRTMFYPVPNVDSAVVRIDIDKNHIRVKDIKLFYRLYRSAFAMRRKTLLNNLTKAFGIDKNRAIELIKLCGFDENIRGERLSAEDFALMSDKLGEMI